MADRPKQSDQDLFNELFYGDLLAEGSSLPDTKVKLPKLTERDRFARKLSHADLPSAGVLSPASFGMGRLCALNLMVRDRASGMDTEKRAARHLRAVVESMDKAAALLLEHYPNASADYLPEYEKARGALLEALDNDRTHEAAFLAVMMATFAFAAGEWPYVWAQQELESRYDQPARISRRHRKTTPGGDYRADDPALILCCAFIRAEREAGREPLQKGLAHWLEGIAGSEVDIPGAGRWAYLELSALTHASGEPAPRVHYRITTRCKERGLGWSTLLKRWRQALKVA